MVRRVVIIPVLNGFVVKVGCQEVVIKSVEELGYEIERYYKHPEKVEEEYLKNAINERIGESQHNPALPCARTDG